MQIFKRQIPNSLNKIPKHGFAFPKNLIINKNNIEKFIIEENLINKKFFYIKIRKLFFKKRRL